MNGPIQKISRRGLLFGGVVAGVLILGCGVFAQNGPTGPGAGGPGGPGGPGGRGGPPQPGQVLPPRLQDQLNLTDDQKKQVAALQAEVDKKLGEILTDDQKKQLAEMRARGPGRGGPMGGGPGGPGGPQGGPGGPMGGQSDGQPGAPPQ